MLVCLARVSRPSVKLRVDPAVKARVHGRASDSGGREARLCSHTCVCCYEERTKTRAPQRAQLWEGAQVKSIMVDGRSRGFWSGGGDDKWDPDRELTLQALRDRERALREEVRRAQEEVDRLRRERELFDQEANNNVGSAKGKDERD